MANAGYPIILCNVTNLYFDLSYNKHENEPGAYWGGFVNEYNSFNVVPYDIYKSVRSDMSGNRIDITKVSNKKIALSPNAYNEIKGMQGQLWAETIRNFDMVEYYLFPKMFGLIERAWNTHPEWQNEPLSDKYTNALRLYNRKISEYELPRLSHLNIKFRIAHPGIEMIDGKLHVNTSIPNAEIRYTIDGSEPTVNSTLWTEPITCNAKEIRAKAFYCGRESVTTLYKYK